jgi:cytochrome c-type biogenesis protein CcmE
VTTPGEDPAAGPDLTPREITVEEEIRRARRRGANVKLWALGLALVAVVGFLLVQFIGNAPLYFLNADEAVAQHADLGQKRFRLQGLVEGEPVDEAGVVSFDVVFNGVTVPVRHVGDPPDLFQVGIPVVLEGRWDETGDWFDSDSMIIKHTNAYEADYGDRLERARSGADS